MANPLELGSPQQLFNGYISSNKFLLNLTLPESDFNFLLPPQPPHSDSPATASRRLRIPQNQPPEEAAAGNRHVCRCSEAPPSR